jgi:hypothetical protein
VNVVYDFGPDETFDRLEAWCASVGDDGVWARYLLRAP